MSGPESSEDITVIVEEAPFSGMIALGLEGIGAASHRHPEGETVITVMDETTTRARLVEALNQIGLTVKEKE